MKIKADYLYCFFTTLIVFLFFAHTLNYPWKYFDEQIIYNETILPIPRSIPEIFEYIKSFGLNHYFEASNPFYSTISNLRTDPINYLITFFVYCFFQKNVFAYHAFSLILHLFNTTILFLLLNRINLNSEEKGTPRYVPTILTLMWALHPTIVEPILFTTNWSAILTYSLCFIVIFYFVNAKGASWHIPTILFVIAIFTCEYSITIPLIVFFYIYANSQDLKHSIKKTLPLFTALAFFVIYFLFSKTRENIIGTIHELPLQITFERIFWLSPQMFFHFLKLIFFPFHLSIDQTGMVKLSKMLLEPYSIFCTLLMCSTLLILLFSIPFIKKRFCYFFFISLAPFLIALLPFLQILSPTYCLASERYLYFPLAMFIFGIAHFLFSRKNTITLIILCIILCIFSTKSYLRTLDWQDSASLFNSALKEAPNDLFKALRLEFLGSILSSKEYISEGITTLENSLVKLEEEKKNYQNKVPEVIKIYGLDPKTIQAKTAYLLAFTKIGLEGNSKAALEILKPHMKDLSITDTQILDLYLGLLFSAGDLDEAEKILNHAVKTKISPTIFIALSEIYKNKYKDLNTAERFLKKSFKYFPYDIQTLSSLKTLYLQANKPNEYARFSYLYNLRTHAR